MNAWRDLRTDALATTREQISDVLLRSGETWIVRGADNHPYPTMAMIGLGQLSLAWPRFLGVLGRDKLVIDLASFVAHITETGQDRPLSEVDLERGFTVLTGGRQQQPTTLVADAAERLTPEVIHFIQFAVISFPALQVIFVAAADFRDRLTDFPFLRARLQPDFVVETCSQHGPAAPQTLTFHTGLSGITG